MCVLVVCYVVCVCRVVFVVLCLHVCLFVLFDCCLHLKCMNEVRVCFLLAICLLCCLFVLYLLVCWVWFVFCLR